MPLPQNPGSNNRNNQPPSNHQSSVFGSDDYDDWGDDSSGNATSLQQPVTPLASAASAPMTAQVPSPQSAPAPYNATPMPHPAQQVPQPSFNQGHESAPDNQWNSPASPEPMSMHAPQEHSEEEYDEEEYDEDYSGVLMKTDLPSDIIASADLLLQAIASDDSTEVIMNGPNEIMIKRDGVRYHVPDIKFGDKDMYHRVINEVLLEHTDTKQRVGDDSYLVEGQLELDVGDGAPPMIARVHMVTPPVVPYAKVTIAKKSRYALTLDDIQSKGSMTRGMSEFIKALAQGRVCIVFSGLSGAGKTTMLEATSHHFDQNDRVIVVEDTPELRLPIADTVYMTASSNRPGAVAQDIVTMEWLVKATNRMRPDRIIVGEVRGPEMSDFLVAANSGADGSMITVHADNPRRCLDKILGLVMRSDGAKSENSVRRDIAGTVQIIVQLALIDGKHRVTHIEEISDTIHQNTGMIASSTIFKYDRSLGRHVPVTRPSEALTNYLSQRGVQISSTWFQP